MKKFLLVCFSFVFALSAMAQERVVTGKVTSADDGTAFPGVNVVLKGTTNGTVTDGEGMYKITVPATGGTLVFSFVGLATQEIEVGERSTLDVPMQSDVQQLAEVYVTAQGIEKTKNELAYAAQKVEGDVVSQARTNNFINSLSGRVAGLDIKQNNSMGGSTNVVIRGVKSLSGNNQALFIIDGVPMDNTNSNSTNITAGFTATAPGYQNQGSGGYDFGNPAADINPDDIGSITVLKGAAATALYGSRASNGVIMITTKKAKGGKGFNLTVNAGVKFGTVDKTTLPTYQNKYGGGYGAFYEDPSGFFLYRDKNDGFIPHTPPAGPDLVVPMSEDASWGAKFDPNLNVYQWDSFDPASPNYGKTRPWVAAQHTPNDFFKQQIVRSYSFLLDGASDRGYYKLGYSRNSEDGIMPNAKLDKDFLNFSASYKVNDKLTTTGTINFLSQHGKGRYGTGYDGAAARNTMTSFREWWEVNNDILELKDAYMRNRKNVTWNWSDPSSLKPIYWDNPYWTRYENYEEDRRLRTYGYGMVNYKFASWVDAMGRVSFDTYADIKEERLAKGSVGVPYYSRYNQNFKEFNYDFMLNLHKELSKDLKFAGVLGANYRNTSTESIYAITNGGLIVPKLYSLANSLNVLNPPTETWTELAVLGLYANANATWKNMITLDVSYRRDKSSSLPKGHNSYPYGSVSASFVFSELIHAPWLTFGKIRANYAEVGTTAAAFSTKDYYTSIPLFGTVPLFSVPGTKNNPDLKPELTKNIEGGLEMSFLDGRVGFDVTYYKSNTYFQILSIPVSRATGYTYKFINAGNVQNQGFEVQAFVTPIKTNDFSWTMNINWTRQRSKILELAPGLNTYQLGLFQGGISVDAALGQPYGAIRGNNFVYTNGQKTVNSSGYYVSSPNSNEIIGNIQPNWVGGISNKFNYKNLAFSFLLDIRNGGQLFNLDMYYGLATGLYKETAGLNDKGNEVRSPVADGGGILIPGVLADGSPNTNYYNATDFGIYGYRRNPAAAFIYNAGFIKLREVMLTYSLPAAIYSKLTGVKGVELSLIGRNLWIIKKYVPYADPEDGLGSGNLASGFQVGTYPNVKSYGFNVKLKF